MITEWEMIIRILFAAFLGGLVGLERERQHQPAGLRTHIILVAGSALAMAMSINLPKFYNINAPTGDPARLAAQVISGIGFLGAGAIMRYGPNVRGLTTATSLWSMAIVGLAVGLGLYYAAFATTALLLIVLEIVNIIEERFIHPFLEITLSLKAVDRPDLVGEVKRNLTKKGQKIVSISLKKNIEDSKINIDLVLRTLDTKAIDTITEQLSHIQGVKSFEIS